jgi:exonuclease III
VRPWTLTAARALSEQVFSGSIKLPNLRITAQNCNSLNLSSPLNIRNKKIVSIINLDSDIIFLSDIRAGNKHNHKIVSDLFKFQYSTYINSTQARKGVGILIKNNSPVQVLETHRDVHENILILKCSVNDTTFILGSVYGPNTDDESFFNDLRHLINVCNCDKIVLGGDWNTTMSPLPGNINPDVFYMVSIPSKNRTDWLLELCNDLDLYDIFRCMNGRDYTHVPYGAKKNRSLIDFFLVSESLYNSIRSCKIKTWYNKKIIVQ